MFGSGCGSGLSGETISENGHQWIGLDISASMLSELIISLITPSSLSNYCKISKPNLSNVDVAVEREVEGDLLLSDMGQVHICLFSL